MRPTVAGALFTAILLTQAVSETTTCTAYGDGYIECDSEPSPFAIMAAEELREEREAHRQEMRAIVSQAAADAEIRAMNNDGYYNE